MKYTDWVVRVIALSAVLVSACAEGTPTHTARSASPPRTPPAPAPPPPEVVSDVNGDTLSIRVCAVRKGKPASISKCGGRALVGAKVEFKVGGVARSEETDSDGLAVLDLGSIGIPSSEDLPTEAEVSVTPTDGPSNQLRVSIASAPVCVKWKAERAHAAVLGQLAKLEYAVDVLGPPWTDATMDSYAEAQSLSEKIEVSSLNVSEQARLKKAKSRLLALKPGYEQASAPRRKAEAAAKKHEREILAVGDEAVIAIIETPVPGYPIPPGVKHVVVKHGMIQECKSGFVFASFVVATAKDGVVAAESRVCLKFNPETRVAVNHTFADQTTLVDRRCDSMSCESIDLIAGGGNTESF